MTADQSVRSTGHRPPQGLSGPLTRPRARVGLRALWGTGRTPAGSCSPTPGPCRQKYVPVHTWAPRYRPVRIGHPPQPARYITVKTDIRVAGPARPRQKGHRPPHPGATVQARTEAGTDPISGPSGWQGTYPYQCPMSGQNGHSDQNGHEGHRRHTGHTGHKGHRVHVRHERHRGYVRQTRQVRHVAQWL